MNSNTTSLNSHLLTVSLAQHISSPVTAVKQRHLAWGGYGLGKILNRLTKCDLPLRFPWQCEDPAGTDGFSQRNSYSIGDRLAPMVSVGGV